MPCSSHDIFPGSSVKLGKESSCSAGIQVQSLSWEDPLEKEMANYSVFLTEKSHGQRILTGHRVTRFGSDLATKPYGLYASSKKNKEGYIRF